MATIKELREQAANAVTAARSKIDAISDKATPEERKEAEIAVDRALDEASELEARAERIAKVEAAEKRAQEAEERAREASRPKYDEATATTGSDMDYRTAIHE